MATENIRINYQVDKSQLESANKELKKAADGNKLTQKEVDNTNSKFEDQNKVLASTNKAFSGLGGQLTALGNKFTIAGRGAGDLASGMFKSATATNVTSKAMNLLKVAIASTGIGLLVVGLGSLVAYFTKTQRGADLLSKAMAGVKAVFSVVIDRMSSFGGAIVSAFENPQATIKGFIQLIKENLINRLVGLLELIPALGKAIQQVSKRDFAGAAKTAGDAVAKIILGVEDFTDKAVAGFNDVKEGVVGLVTEITNEAKAAADLEGRMQKLRDAEIAFIETKAKLRREIAASRLAVEEEQRANETLAEANARRYEAAQKGIDAQNKLSSIEIGLARQKAQIIEQQLALGENLEEDERALAEAKAAVIDLDTQRDETLKRLITRQNAFNEAVKEGIDIELEAIEIKGIAKDEEFEKEKERSKQRLAQLLENKEQEVVVTGNTAEEQKAIEEDIANAKDAILNDGVKLLEDTLGKEHVLTKAAAIAQALQNTSVGVTKALSSSPPPFNVILAGITAAAGAVQINKIRQYEKGGRIGGQRHKNGGTIIEAERDEFVMSRKATAKYGFDFMDKVNNLELNDLTAKTNGKSINIVDIMPIAKQLKEMPQNIINIDGEGFTLQQRRGHDIINRKLNRYTT